MLQIRRHAPVPVKATPVKATGGRVLAQLSMPLHGRLSRPLHSLQTGIATPPCCVGGHVTKVADLADG